MLYIIIIIGCIFGFFIGAIFNGNFAISILLGGILGGIIHISLQLRGRP